MTQALVPLTNGGMTEFEAKSLLQVETLLLAFERLGKGGTSEKAVLDTIERLDLEGEDCLLSEIAYDALHGMLDSDKVNVDEALEIMASLGVDNVDAIERLAENLSWE